MTKITDYAPAKTVLRDVQVKALDEVQNHWHNNDIIILCAPTACHGLGQGIRMFDGTVKAIEDIEIGEEVMGPDSKPRRVINTHRGTDHLNKIVPDKGRPWTATDTHILRLWHYYRYQEHNERFGQFVHEEVTVSEYANKAKNYKAMSFMQRVGVEYSEKELTIPPYILGIWLGDGHTDTPAITSMDHEIFDEWNNWGVSLGLHTRINSNGSKALTYYLVGDIRGGVKDSNSCTAKLRKLGVLGHKHIPLQYLTGSRSQRLELLAGLIDTDGHTAPGKNSVEITQVKEEMLDNIITLVRSLGYSANKTVKVVNGVNYYRCHISGTNMSEVPVRLAYKQPTNSGNNQNNYRFTVRPLGMQEFAGITVDQDHLYLLEDFTITHNSGKSHLAVTVGNWAREANYRTAIITPQVLLQDQYQATFPDLPMLKGKSRYSCKDKDYPTCEDRHSIDNKYCPGCPYVEAREKIHEAPVGIYNLYSYMFDSAAERDYAEVLIVDEAHAVVSQLQDFYTLKLWQHVDGYPDSINTQGDAVVWMETYLEKLDLDERAATTVAAKLKIARQMTKFKALIRGINRDPGHFFYEKKMEMYRGSKKECIEIRPVTLEHTVGSLWTHHKKIVLMSGTIRAEDMEYLGLKRKRAVFIEVESPIPPAQRPIKIKPIAQMSYQNQSTAIPKLCKEIMSLAEMHKGKGIIHITYALIPLFKKHLDDDRFMWHTQETKGKVYEKFRASTENKILMAAGMAEGIDLVGEDYEWQVIAKIMFPSLGDALVQRQKEKEPKWYEWQTIKSTVQQAGRICRTPTDYGVTYILDSSFVFLYRKSKQLFPKYFQDAVVWDNERITK